MHLYSNKNVYKKYSLHGRHRHKMLGGGVADEGEAWGWDYEFGLKSEEIILKISIVDFWSGEVI